jgi:hypothetical protein
MENATILESNRNAVEMLASGSYRDAVFAFRSTLEMLLPHISEEPDVFEVVQDGSPEIAVELVSCQTSESARARSNMEDSTFEFYGKAFRIIGTDDSSSFDSVRKQNQASVTVLYNMALAFHLMAMHSATDRDTNLKKALKLYEMAFHINVRRIVLSSIDNFFAMAILNNRGSIYAYLFDMERMHHCLEGLRRCLDFPQYVHEPARDGVEQNYLNVALLYGWHVHPAAPAA